jgi:hypothetical protein
MAWRRLRCRRGFPLLATRNRNNSNSFGVRRTLAPRTETILRSKSILSSLDSKLSGFSVCTTRRKRARTRARSSFTENGDTIQSSAPASNIAAFSCSLFANRNTIIGTWVRPRISRHIRSGGSATRSMRIRSGRSFPSLARLCLDHRAAFGRQSCPQRSTSPWIVSDNQNRGRCR